MSRTRVTSRTPSGLVADEWIASVRLERFGDFEYRFPFGRGWLGVRAAFRFVDVDIRNVTGQRFVSG